MGRDLVTPDPAQSVQFVIVIALAIVGTAAFVVAAVHRARGDATR